MTTLMEHLRSGAPLEFGVIDMHGHLGRYAYPIPDLSFSGLVRVMDRVGIVKTVCSHMQCMSTDTDWGNGEVLRGMEAFPDRIRGYVSVFPSQAACVRESVLRWLERGFTGLKFHDSNQISYSDDAYTPAYEIAHERGLPVLWHTWGQDAEFRAAVSVARRFPGLSLLLAHSGSANVEGYLKAANEAENIYLETCFSRAPRGMIERLVSGVGSGKVVWGSDSYFYSMTQQIGRVLGADLADDDKQRILRENAVCILGRIHGERSGTVDQ